MPQTTHTDNIPDWLRQFAERVADCLSAGFSLAPIGCHCAHNEAAATWEVTLFVSRTEISGGHKDGLPLPSLLTVDINAVSRLFDQPPEVHLQALEFAEKAEPGTYLSFIGTCGEHRIWLRIPQQAPGWSDAGRILDASTGDVRDLW